MYAIIESGAKQYRVKEGDVIDVEVLKSEKQTTFTQILCLHNGKTIQLGQPYLQDYIVKAEVIETIRGPKVVAFRYKRRKNQRRKQGHRQSYCRVKITSICANEKASQSLERV